MFVLVSFADHVVVRLWEGGVSLKKFTKMFLILSVLICMF